MMNQKIWSGLTAALITTALTTTSSSYAEGTRASEQTPNNNHQRISAISSSGTDTETVSAIPGEYRSFIQNQNQANIDRDERPSASSVISAPQPVAGNLDVVKVGEYQSHNQSHSDEDAIAKIESHKLAGRQAATLFIRDIPVLTFLGPVSTNQSETKIGRTGDSKDSSAIHSEAGESELYANGSAQNSTQASGDEISPSDPVWRAANLAARINQLSREAIDANSITVVWNSENKSPATTSISGRDNSESYIIQVNGEKLVEVNADTRLPDTTNNLAQDALQITNRLRRLMGNAPPLQDIAGKPERTPKPIRIALTTRPILSSITGVASWYGPGFHGNRSANGEIFNQNAFTAAHRNLPFGTQVKVTNLNNGLSVIVRINDRGPYARGRIIDLSAAAARTLGMMQTGVAPVRLEILGRPQTVAIDEN